MDGCRNNKFGSLYYLLLYSKTNRDFKDSAGFPPHLKPRDVITSSRHRTSPPLSKPVTELALVGSLRTKSFRCSRSCSPPHYTPHTHPHKTHSRPTNTSLGTQHVTTTKMSLLRVMNTTGRVVAMHPDVTASVRRTSARYGQILLQGGVSTTAADSADRSRHSGDSTHMAAAASAVATPTTRSIGTKKKVIGAKDNEEEMRPGDRSQVHKKNTCTIFSSSSPLCHR